MSSRQPAKARSRRAKLAAEFPPRSTSDRLTLARVEQMQDAIRSVLEHYRDPPIERLDRFDDEPAIVSRGKDGEVVLATNRELATGALELWPSKGGLWESVLLRWVDKELNQQGLYLHTRSDGGTRMLAALEELARRREVERYVERDKGRDRIAWRLTKPASASEEAIEAVRAYERAVQQLGGGITEVRCRELAKL